MAMGRVKIAACCFSAAGLVGLVAHESYTEKAVIPTKNDRPTVGFGSTFREDGSPVQMGDTITPQKALARTAAHISKDEAGLKKCMAGAELNQAEYDILVDFTYQYGAIATCSSTMARKYLAGDYAGACEGYLLYKKSGGFDCSLPINKRICGGVWTRNLERHEKCLEASK